MHDVQRIAGLLHVQPGDGAPGAADRVEGAVAPAVDPGHARDLLVGDVDGVLDPVAGGIEQAQAAERQRGGPAQGLALDLDQLQAAAAEVAGNAVGRAKAHHDAVGGELGLALAGQDLDPGAQRPLAAGDELGAVGGVAAGGGGDRPDVLDAEDAGDGLEAAERLERGSDALLAEPAGRADLAAQAAQHLLVEDRRGASDRALVDDEPHRVRADVDDAHRLEVAVALEIAVVAAHAGKRLSSASAALDQCG